MPMIGLGQQTYVPDEDYIYSNMAKATAQEWGVEDIP